MPYVHVPVHHGHYHGRTITPEEGLAALIIINVLGLISLLYVLHKNKRGSLSDKFLNGPFITVLFFGVAVSIDGILLLISAIQLLAQLL